MRHVRNTAAMLERTRKVIGISGTSRKKRDGMAARVTACTRITAVINRLHQAGKQLRANLHIDSVCPSAAECCSAKAGGHLARFTPLVVGTMPAGKLPHHAILVGAPPEATANNAPEMAPWQHSTRTLSGRRA